MGTHNITKRTFFKKLGGLAALGLLVSLFKKSKSANDFELPLVAVKDPNAMAYKKDIS